MTRLLINRILAWTIDVGLIALYAVLLFAVTSLFFDVTQKRIDPFVGQLIGFITLTLPVFVYSYGTEISKRKATIGKRILNLTVQTSETKEKKNILLRNILKYLPWEIAHTGVHWLFYYEANGSEIPSWIWGMLIGPQLIVLIYFVSMVTSQGKSSVYDSISGTQVQLQHVP